MNSFIQHNILYSCEGQHQKLRDVLLPDHMLSFVLTGNIEVYTPTGKQRFGAGTLCLSQRNQLIKARKTPVGDEPFTAINISFDRALLQNYSEEYNVKATGPYTGDHNVWLPLDSFMKGYFDSLLPYFDVPEQLTAPLAKAKTTEAIALLLRNPALKNFLFDFNEPFKIDLEMFMSRYFTHNAPIEQFAKLTGRSLSAFKRDFQKTFYQTPEKWLKEQRLNQAHFLLAEDNQKPSEVYLQVGFENFSHFSTSFREKFGYTASTIYRGEK